MPTQGKLAQSPSHARSASTPPDQSLFQLVQSRAPNQPSQQQQQPAVTAAAAAAAFSSHQLERQVRALPEGSMQAQQPQMVLVSQRSGNPFAAEDSASSSTVCQMPMTSHIAQLPSGNPFEEGPMSLQVPVGGRVAQPPGNTLTHQAPGNEPRSISGRTQQDFGSEGLRSGVAHQAAVSDCLGGGSPVASLACKDPEMSPLQNGLIR